jgi:hypothetical protein
VHGSQCTTLHSRRLRHENHVCLVSRSLYEKRQNEMIISFVRRIEIKTEIYNFVLPWKSFLAVLMLATMLATCPRTDANKSNPNTI